MPVFRAATFANLTGTEIISADIRPARMVHNEKRGMLAPGAAPPNFRCGLSKLTYCVQGAEIAAIACCATIACTARVGCVPSQKKNSSGLAHW